MKDLSQPQPASEAFVSQDHRVAIKDNSLAGLDLAVGVCGSIAVVEMVKNIRHFRRYGANVRVYATKKALNFVSERALAWASGKSVISDFHFEAGHVFSHDMLLIAPATLNKLAQIASGVADDVVSTLAQSLLGFRAMVATTVAQGENNSQETTNEKYRKPEMIIAPCMHLSMAYSPSYQKSYARLKELGVVFVDPLIEEDKYKLSDSQCLIDYLVRTYHVFLQKPLPWKNKKVLITAGSVSVPIDPVRFLGNRASGETGYQLARRAFFQQAKVHLLVHNSFSRSLPLPVTFHYYRDYRDYQKMTMEIVEKNDIELVLFSAAVSDFLPKNAVTDKISSAGACQIDLIPAPKIISLVEKKFPSVKIIAFKLFDFQKNDVKKLLKDFLNDHNYRAVVATDQATLSDGKGNYSSSVAKRIVAFPAEKEKIIYQDVRDFDHLCEILFHLSL